MWDYCGVMRRAFILPSERAGRQIMTAGTQGIHERAVKAAPVSWKVHTFSPVGSATNILNTQQSVEFLIPEGKLSEIEEILLYYTISNSNTASAALLMPTWFHCDQVEIEQGGDLQETLYPEWEHFIHMALRPTEWYTLVAADLNIDTGYDEPAGTTIALSSTDTYVMPLWTLFQQSDVPMHRLKGDIRIRFRFTTFANAEVTASCVAGNLTCTAMKLYITDRHLKAPFDSQQAADHRDLILPYLEVTRELVTTATTAGTRVDIKPASLSGNVAFVIIGDRVTAATNDTLLDFTALTDFTLKDPTGRIIGDVQQYPSALQRLELGSKLPNPAFLASIPYTIIPFTSDLVGTMLKGAQFGFETLPTNSLININPATTATEDIMVIVGKYRHLRISNGKMTVIRA